MTKTVKCCKIQIYIGGDIIKKKEKTTQEWIGIDKITKDGIIVIEEKKYIKILKIIPINYNLKSDLEKSSILNSYKIFLKTCNFDIQILIQSNKEDLTNHINNIQKNINKRENLYLKEIAEEYIQYISEINLTKKSSSKDFYIIISDEKTNEEFNSYEIIKNDLKEKYFKIKECLVRCGNNVIEINEKKDIINIFYSFLNTRKFINYNYFLKENKNK